jgi:hypothetical protein
VFSHKIQGCPLVSTCSQKCLDEYLKVPVYSKSKAALQAPAEMKKTDKCCVCGKQSASKHKVAVKNGTKEFCSDGCLTSYIGANRLTVSSCAVCLLSCGRSNAQPQTIQFEGNVKNICSNKCLEEFKRQNAKTVP